MSGDVQDDTEYDLILDNEVDEEEDPDANDLRRRASADALLVKEAAESLSCTNMDGVVVVVVDESRIPEVFFVFFVFVFA